jgi:phosphatidylglycerophosphatase C
MPQLAVFDLDKTLCRHDTFVAFLLFMLKRHPTRWWRLPLLGVATLAHAVRLRDNSWLKAVFLRHVVGGMEEHHVAAECGLFLRQVIWPRLARIGLAEIAAWRQRDATVVLATASPDIYVSRLAQMLHIEHIVCTHLERDEDGRMTGRLLGGNCYGVAKLDRINEFRLARGVEWSDVTCYSDHISDMALMLQAGQAYAVNPARIFAEECRRKRIPILRWT